MCTAKLHLYPIGDKPMCLLSLKIDRCLQFLLPYLDVCRRSKRADDVVAEISFTDGRSIWFASREGMIDMALDQPRLRVSLLWLTLLPFLVRQGVPRKCASDEEIRNFVTSVYDNAAT
jgi:hypothetical protein